MWRCHVGDQKWLFSATSCCARGRRWRPTHARHLDPDPTPSLPPSWMGCCRKRMSRTCGSNCSTRILESEMKRLTGCIKKRVNFWQSLPRWCQDYEIAQTCEENTEKLKTWDTEITLGRAEDLGNWILVYQHFWIICLPGVAMSAFQLFSLLVF